MCLAEQDVTIREKNEKNISVSRTAGHEQDNKKDTPNGGGHASVFIRIRTKRQKEGKRKKKERGTTSFGVPAPMLQRIYLFVDFKNIVQSSQDLQSM
mmetsp:Transcript_3826/g.7885  ORF Transcript_3826/g.7885 Transcript_3826/m.7885 type:complete len:97 (-) Transcript_3826:2906-3196(-)